MSFQLYYASDIHGSDLLWRKFVNAGRFYEVDVLVMGGDITGKAVVPIVKGAGGRFTAREVRGDAFGEDEVEAVERAIRDRGFYPYVTDEDELAAVRDTEGGLDDLFRRAMSASVERWMGLAEERLEGTGIKLYVMLGNDDEPHLREVLQASPLGVDCEDEPVVLGEGIQMLSCGHANTTPWNSPREMPEEELAAHLETLVARLEDPGKAVFNLHVPPQGTAIDQAPRLDADLKPIVKGGSVQMDGAGSRAVRDLIERYQPPLALHGHIHESRGTVKIGKTVCINPGSEYGEGVLHGALVVLDKKKGLRNHQLVSG
jgi:Icc-related predicted phosphoesterase